MNVVEQKRIVAETNELYAEKLKAFGGSKAKSTRAQRRGARQAAREEMEIRYAGAVNIALIMKIVMAVLSILAAL